MSAQVGRRRDLTGLRTASPAMHRVRTTRLDRTRIRRAVQTSEAVVSPGGALVADPRSMVRSTDADDIRLLAAIAYVPLLNLIPLTSRRNDAYLRGHVSAGLLLTAMAIGVAVLGLHWKLAMGVVSVCAAAGMIAAITRQTFPLGSLSEPAESLRRGVLERLTPDSPLDRRD